MSIKSLDIEKVILRKVPSKYLFGLKRSGHIGIRWAIILNQSRKELVDYLGKYKVLSISLDVKRNHILISDYTVLS